MCTLSCAFRNEALETFPSAAFHKVLSLNLYAPFFLTRALLPLLEAAATQTDYARVINIGSVDGIQVNPRTPVRIGRL